MIMDQVKAAATELKGQAAEVIVQQKVAEKLARAQEKYDVPDKYLDVMGGFFTSYMTEVYKAGLDMDTYEETLTVLFQKVLACAKEPHQFEPYHTAIREPFDYYKMGNDFAGGVIDQKSSKIVGVEKIDEINERLAAGDNVVLLANHQSEADPQIFSVLLDPIAPGFAEKTIFVAGDRVTTDLLAQPFSMGRNLLCIFSKKHLDVGTASSSPSRRRQRAPPHFCSSCCALLLAEPARAQVLKDEAQPARDETNAGARAREAQRRTARGASHATRLLGWGRRGGDGAQHRGASRGPGGETQHRGVAS